MSHYERLVKIEIFPFYLIISSFCSPLAFAQTQYPPAPPIHVSTDENGVDRISGKVTIPQSLSIGPRGLGLSFEQYGIYQYGNSNYDLRAYVGTSYVTLYFGKTRKNFTLSGSSYISDNGDGSNIALSGSIITYTDNRGTVITYDRNLNGYNFVNTGFGTSIVQPGGESAQLTYETVIRNDRGSPNPPIFVRLRSVNNNLGYQIKFTYDQEAGTPNAGAWQTLSKVTGINNAVEYCSPSATCTLSNNWPALSYSTILGTGTQTQTITDSLGNQTVYSLTNWAITGIKYPGSSSNDVTIAYGADGRVSSFNNRGHITTYTWSLSGATLTGTSTDSLSRQRVTQADTSLARILSDTNALGNTTKYQYDSFGRMTYEVLPEGVITGGVPTSGFTKYTYDSRGNISEVRKVAKTPGSPPDIVSSSAYQASCSNMAICNLPSSRTDPLGRTTDYSYNSTTGQITSVLSPAATTGAVRPEVRYTYSSLYAWFKNSSGVIVQAASPVSMLTGTSQCQTTASCLGAIDEVKVIFAYQAGASGVGSNLMPSSISQASGNGALTATNSVTYDNVGNRITIDGPLIGSADTWRYRYNANRQLVGVVSPDPDGAGPLKFRALRYTYDPQSNIISSELGTVNSQSDTDWASLTSLQQSSSVYDSAGRKIKDALTAGGTTYALTQYSYDSANRLTCTALRMDATQWGSQTDACLPQTTSSNGPDRVVKKTYNAADQLLTNVQGYGTAAVATERTMTYTNNGFVQTLKDAGNNLTTYEYDGLDRLVKTRFPQPASGANVSSTTDYEQVGFDANSNIISRRLRDGVMVYYGYDNLNRLNSKNRPNTAWWETDITYTYDLLGRLTSAADSNGHSYSFNYDALDRKVSESSNWYGTMTSSYDLAGRRTSLTYPDGFYVNYDYMVTGEMAAVREYGATSGVGVLASYSYDDFGHRTGITRGNGTVTSYTYDPMSRLSSLGQNLNGTAQDLTLGFSYNPASQIITSTRSNDAYIFSGNVNVNRNYTINGQGQYSSAGSVALGYDGRGNLASSASQIYSYTADNQLATAASQSNYAYDPMGRLFHESTPNSAMLYDGSDMVVERDATNGVIRRRYVYGAGADEPIVWYEGSGTADRRWLHADERGSIIATTDSAGNSIGINSYDEFGIPAAGNIGRFQYTGQMWLPNIGMYNYKARFYSATLGRFMQTDPIGYNDGLNWYNYVAGDPVNRSDPTGLSCRPEPCDGAGAGTSNEPPIVVTGGRPSTGVGLGAGVNDRAIGAGGFDGGSGRKKSGGSKPQKTKVPDCGYVLDPNNLIRTGQVTFSGLSGGGALVLGFSVTNGKFRTESGVTGTFTSIEFLGGLRGEAGVITGFSKNLSTFIGGNDTFFSSISLDDISGAKDLDGNLVGASTTVFGKGIDIGFSGGFSNTDVTITGCPHK